MARVVTDARHALVEHLKLSQALARRGQPAAACAILDQGITMATRSRRTVPYLGPLESLWTAERELRYPQTCNADLKRIGHGVDLLDPYAPVLAFELRRGVTRVETLLRTGGQEERQLAAGILAWARHSLTASRLYLPVGKLTRQMVGATEALEQGETAEASSLLEAALNDLNQTAA